MFENVVDVAKDGKYPSHVYFDEQKKLLGESATVFRYLGIFLCILGHYLLFSPIIKILGMIPLVGWLLSGIVAVAAAIFAFIVGLTLSVLTIAIAWVFFRPLIGIPLLILASASIYLTFFFDWSGVSAEEIGEDTTPTIDDASTIETNDGRTTVST